MSGEDSVMVRIKGNCRRIAVGRLNLHVHHKIVVIRTVKTLSQREAPFHQIPEIKCNGVNL